MFNAVVWFVLLGALLGSSRTENDAHNANEDEEGVSLEETFRIDDYDDAEDPGVFQPTDQWQDIQKGQSIPQGLHVRMNLETGKREAKLMDDDEDRSADQPYGDPRRSGYYGHSDRRGIINKSTKVFTREEYAAMLKALREDKQDEGDVPLLSFSGVSSPKPAVPTGDHATEKDDEHVKGSALPLLQEMLTFHPEVELMLEQLQVLADTLASPSDLVQALEELEYHAHQIDNAKDLDSIGGLVLVVRLLNHSDVEVVSAACLVLGAAVQSNPEVQLQVLAYGSMPLLVRLLSPTKPDLLQRRATFAISALMRGQSEAVSLFLKENGIEKLSEQMDNRSPALLSKGITLISDILNTEMTEYREGIESDISVAVVENGWCEQSPKLLVSNEARQWERSLGLMERLLSRCDFAVHLGRLEELKAVVHLREAAGEDDGMDYAQLLTAINRVTSHIRAANKEL